MSPKCCWFPTGDTPADTTTPWNPRKACAPSNKAGADWLNKQVVGLVTKNKTQHSALNGTRNHSKARPHLDTVFSGALHYPHTAQGACYYHADVNVGALRESSAKTKEGIGLVSRECMIRKRRLLLMARLHLPGPPSPVALVAGEV